MQADLRNTTGRRKDLADKSDTATVEKIITLLGKIQKSKRRKRIGRSSWVLLLTHLTGWQVEKNEIESIVQKFDLREGRYVRPPVSWITPELIRRAAD